MRVVCGQSAAAARVDDDVVESPHVVVRSSLVAVEQVHRTQAGGDAARRRRRLTSTPTAGDDGPQHGVVADVECGRCAADHPQRTAPGTVVDVEATRVDDRVGPAESLDVHEQVVALTQLARGRPRIVSFRSSHGTAALCTHKQ